MPNSTFNRGSVIKIILSVFLIGLLFGGCAKPADIRTPTRKPSPSPSTSDDQKKESSETQFKQPITFKGSRIQSRDKDRKNWTLEAKEIEYDQANEKAEARDVSCTFFDAKNRETLFIKAEGARINLKNNSLKFTGTVNANTGKGEKLTATDLRWDGVRKKIIGQGFIKLIRDKSTLTAQRIVADPDLKNVKLSGNVKVLYPNLSDLF